MLRGSHRRNHQPAESRDEKKQRKKSAEEAVSRAQVDAVWKCPQVDQGLHFRRVGRHPELVRLNSGRTGAHIGVLEKAGPARRSGVFFRG